MKFPIRGERAGGQSAPARPEKMTEAEALKLKLHAMHMERDFWVEQARTLQNHLQTVLRGQAAIMEQMARSAVAPDDVVAAVDRLALELRKPLTTVEATVALAAVARGGSQGVYTAVQADGVGRLERVR